MPRQVIERRTEDRGAGGHTSLAGGRDSKELMDPLLTPVCVHNACMSIYTHIHTHIYIYTNVCLYVYAHVMCVSMHIYIYVHVHIYMSICTLLLRGRRALIFDRAPKSVPG